MSGEAGVRYQTEGAHVAEYPPLRLVRDCVEPPEGLDKSDGPDGPTAIAEVIDLTVRRRQQLAAERSIQETQAERIHDIFTADFIEDRRRWLFTKSVGATALKASRTTVRSVDTKAESLEEVNLLTSARAAGRGNEQARKMVDFNAGSAIHEASEKVDTASEFFLDLTSDGDLHQEGQRHSQIYQNTREQIKHSVPELRACQNAEFNTAAIMPYMAHNGFLDGHTVFSVSLVPEGPAEDELNHNGAGFFLKTMSYNIQAFTRMPDGRVRLQTVFLAGVESEDHHTYQDRLNRRHDFTAIAKLYEHFGFKAPTTAAELLNDPLRVPNESMPNGIANLVYICKKATDEFHGRDTTCAPEDFMNIIEETELRQEKLAGIKQHVVAELINRSHELSSPMEAVRLMWELIKDRMVEAALTNHDIDLDMFGDDGEAKRMILHAREQAALGNHEVAEQSINEAKKAATVGGCGGGVSNKDGIKNSASASEASVATGKDDRNSTARLKKAKERRAQMPTHMDICAVTGCPSNEDNKPVLCGPCNICMFRCQVMFDDGKDPSRPPSIGARIAKANNGPKKGTITSLD